MNFRPIGIWILRLVPTIILLQSLYFNIAAYPPFVRLFTQIGMEPYGRFGTGILELVAAVLLLIPKFTGYGAILGLIMMTGALYFHLTRIGIFFEGDAELFVRAMVTFICCAGLILIYKSQLENQLKRK